MKFALKTLGCKVNQAESDLLSTSVRVAGWEVVSFQDLADVYVINSCAVTREAERKTGQFIRRALRANPEARVWLTGCLARKITLDTLSPFEERVEVLASIHKLEELMKRIGALGGLPVDPVETPAVRRARVWMKLQDGCDHNCSYCIVPRLRGPVTSLPPAQIIRSIQSLDQKGYREVVLCGINLGYYGKNSPYLTLIDLLERLVETTSQIRLRLSSLEPFAVTDAFVDRYFDLGDRVCAHFHLPLQSGSDHILSMMNRGYTTRDYTKIVERVRKKYPMAAITTDLMVGFPGESASLFQETVEYVRGIGFARTHLFMFSPRPETPAYELDKTQGISRLEKKQREEILKFWAEQSRFRYQNSFLGKIVPVLIESVKGKMGKGHSDTYLEVEVGGVGGSVCGEIVDVSLERLEEGVLKGNVSRTGD